MTTAAQMFLAFAHPEQAQLVRLLSTATAPLAVATLSTLLGRPPRDVRRSLRGLQRAGVVDDRHGAVTRTSALDATLVGLWLDLEQSCCSRALFASTAPIGATNV